MQQNTITYRVAHEAADILKTDRSRRTDVVWSGDRSEPPFTGPAWRKIIAMHRQGKSASQGLWAAPTDVFSTSMKRFEQRDYRWLLVLGIAFVVALAIGCARPESRQITSSAYPLAVDASKVGSYPGFTKSGAGYFYDDVLEYRVWINAPERGDYHFQAFARYEDALAFSKTTNGAQEPLVLIRQKEWIDEPRPGVFHVEHEERITEWRVEWLADGKRTPGAIERFMEAH
jgi:hypothetical protein